MKFYIFFKKISAAIFSVSLFFLIYTYVPEAMAYENLASGSSSLKCQTTCHQAENLLKAHRDKEIKSQCRDCHTGKMPLKAKSPFQPVKKLRRASAASSFPATILRSSTQMASAVKNKPDKKSSGKKESSSSAPPGMVAISAGEFIMGSNERWDDESPEHLAATAAFYIDLHEVTNEKYKAFTDATQRETPYHWPEGKLPKGKEQHPVVYVSWFDARDYCAWDGGKRLPNEQEWEKASRGEDGFTYPWGHEWTLDKSNNPYKHSKGTVPVGSYPEGRSPYGLYDMSGNVWEWVDSYYLPHPGNTVHRAEYGEDKRILKGGSWFDCLSYGCGLSAPTFNRSFFTPEVRNNSFGFRCAKTP
jgi:formylglycine-generating enzyme required for sulfatase activity